MQPKQSLAAAVAASAVNPDGVLSAGAASNTGPVGSIRLGGPIFDKKSDDPEELALAHRKLGYGAAYCPNIPLTDTARIRAAADAFAKHDVVIAEVGRWVNLLDRNA